LYVDDIIVTGNNVAALQSLIVTLGKEFDLKDLGPFKFFLGLQIKYKATGFFDHQRKYATDLLSKLICPPASLALPLLFLSPDFAKMIMFS
jgi:hypothetical protein